jgi:hypothetical protein
MSEEKRTMSYIEKPTQKTYVTSVYIGDIRKELEKQNNHTVYGDFVKREDGLFDAKLTMNTCFYSSTFRPNITMKPEDYLAPILRKFEKVSEIRQKETCAFSGSPLELRVEIDGILHEDNIQPTIVKL